MGSKHDKKRYFIVKYQINKDGKWDELIELSKKKVGPGKIKESGIVLDLLKKEVLKCDIPGIPAGTQVPYDNIYNHFHKTYAKILELFIK